MGFHNDSNFHPEGTTLQLMEAIEAAPAPAKNFQLNFFKTKRPTNMGRPFRLKGVKLILIN